MIDNRFPAPGTDTQFPEPGVDTRFPSPGVDTRFPSPGQDARFMVLDPEAPVITGIPTISGTPEVGQTLTAFPAPVTGFPPPTRTWQWFRSPDTELGTGQNYTLVDDDEGFTIFVRQIETNSEGSDSADSDPTAEVDPAPVVTEGAWLWEDGQEILWEDGSTIVQEAA